MTADPGTEGACRACDAPMLWLANTTTGRVAPIDAEPDPLGNVTIDREAGTYKVWPAGSVPEGSTCHTSHFATCPYPGRFRS